MYEERMSRLVDRLKKATTTEEKLSIGAEIQNFIDNLILAKQYGVIYDEENSSNQIDRRTTQPTKRKIR